MLFCAAVLGAAFVKTNSDIVVAALWIVSVCLPALYAVRMARKAGATWFPADGGLLRSSLHFGWRSHAGSVTQYFQQRIDVVLVACYLPLKELGIYSLAISIAELLLYVPQAIAPILMPSVAASDTNEANQMTSLLCRISVLLAAALSGGVALASTWIVPWILPAFGPSVWVVWLLLPGVIAASLCRILASNFNGRGRPLETLFPPTVALAACTVAGIFVLPKYGIRGEALVTSAGYLLNSLLYFFSYQRMTSERLRDLLFLKGSDLRAARNFCRTSWAAMRSLRKPPMSVTGARLMILTTADMGLRLMRGQLAYLREAGFDVTVVSSPGEYLQRTAREEHVHTIAIRMAREISPLNDLVALFRIYRLIRLIKPSIVTAATPKAGLLGCLAAWLARVPCRVYWHLGLRAETLRGWRRTVMLLADKSACRAAHRVICVSESLRAEIIARALVGRSKTAVLASGSCNGVDVEHFAQSDSRLEAATSLRATLRIPNDAPVIGFVGRFTRDKGVTEVVGAYERLRHNFPDLRLLMLGDFEAGDPVSESVREQIAHDAQIVHPGFVDDPAPYFQVFDLLVLPTRREGFPTVCLEAHAAGKPVVATRATGTVDAVRDGVDGFLVPQDSMVVLAQAIELLLEDKALRERMAEAGRRRVATEFTRERVWNAFLEEYKRLLNARGIAEYVHSYSKEHAEFAARPSSVEP